MNLMKEVIRIFQSSDEKIASNLRSKNVFLGLKIIKIKVVFGGEKIKN